MDTAYDDTDNIVLHRFFERHADKVGKELLSASTTQAGTDGDDDKGSGSGKRSWNAICNALVENPQASLIPTVSTLSSKEHHDYLELMARYSHRDTTSVQHLFVPAVTPKVRSYFASQSSINPPLYAGSTRNICALGYQD